MRDLDLTLPFNSDLTFHDWFYIPNSKTDSDYLLNVRNRPDKAARALGHISKWIKDGCLPEPMQ